MEQSLRLVLSEGAMGEGAPVAPKGHLRDRRALAPGYMPTMGRLAGPAHGYLMHCPFLYACMYVFVLSLLLRFDHAYT